MIANFFKRMFLYSAGLTYTNMARLFMRLFIGVMLMSIGIRQIAHYNELATSFDSVFGIPGDTSLLILILIEVICSTLIILGLFTRFSVLPPLGVMILAEQIIAQYHDTLQASPFLLMQAGYLPIMFIGVFIFILLAGPGKISLDYIISVNLTSVDEKGEAEAKEFELENS